MWQELLAGLSWWISTLQFPSLSMTEVPIPSTNDGGEQRGRTRDLKLRLVLGIILAFSEAEDGKHRNN